MKPPCDLLLCVAVGPGEVVGAVDLLDSARCYLDGRYRVIVVDDTGGVRLWSQLRLYDEVDYLRNWKRCGFRYLLQSIQRAYRHALGRYDFAAVLKLDPDALITGPGLSCDILGHLETHPKAGMLGAVGATESGRAYWQARLEANLEHWRDLVEKAKRWGYRMGESALGGAYALSRCCLEDMSRAGYLWARPRGERIAEDVTFSLFVRSLGYEIHEFGGQHQPLELAWRGLPISKEEIVGRKKKVIHSVKFNPEDLRVRGHFERIRRRHMEHVPLAAARWTPMPPGPPARSCARRLRVGLLCRRLAADALDRDRMVRARRLLRTAVAADPWQLSAWGMRLFCWLPGGASRPALGTARAGRRLARKLAAWTRPA